MNDDHIGVEINGVLYVKLEDARKLREGWDKADAEIEKLRAALLRAKEFFLRDEPLAACIEVCAALGEKE